MKSKKRSKEAPPFPHKKPRTPPRRDGRLGPASGRAVEVLSGKKHKKGKKKARAVVEVDDGVGAGAGAASAPKAKKGRKTEVVVLSSSELSSSEGEAPSPRKAKKKEEEEVVVVLPSSEEEAPPPKPSRKKAKKKVELSSSSESSSSEDEAPPPKPTKKKAKKKVELSSSSESPSSEDEVPPPKKKAKKKKKSGDKPAAGAGVEVEPAPAEVSDHDASDGEDEPIQADLKATPEALGAYTRRLQSKYRGAPMDYNGSGFTHNWTRDKKHARDFKHGSWNSLELALLLESVESSCMAAGLFTDEERQGLWQPSVSKLPANIWVDIARPFQFRTLGAIRRRCIRYYHPNNNQGPLTREEKATLHDMVAAHGRKWQLIGVLMKRLPYSLNVQYNRLASKSHGDWWPQDEEKLKAMVEKWCRKSGMAATSTLHSGTGTGVALPWAKFAKKLGRTSEATRVKWMMDVGPKATGVRWSSADDLTLVQGVAAQKPLEHSDIDFLEVGLPHSRAMAARRFRVLCKRFPQPRGMKFGAYMSKLVAEVAGKGV